MKLFLHNSRFLTLLLALILMIFISPFLQATYLGKWLVSLSFIIVIVAIVFTALEKFWHFIMACSIAAMIIILYTLLLFTQNQLLQLVELGLSLLFFMAAIYMIFHELIAPQRITFNTVCAALSIYLLLGLIYAHAYLILENLLPGSFIFNTAALPQQALSQFNLIYFSFTTLTTVGFGDIIATNDYARALVVLEEISGVLYLAVIVARLVAGLKQIQR